MTVYQLPLPPEDPAFCHTPSALDMIQVIDVACELGEMGAIVAAPGTGKTTTLNWYAGQHKGAACCVMNPAQSSMSQVLARLAAALDGPAPGLSAAEAHGHICRLAARRQPDAILIDEAQHLDDRSLDTIRCIHDETAVPVIFAGNESLRSRVSATKESAFAQFASRIGPQLVIGGTTAEDVAALAHHRGLEDREAISWLKKRCVGVAGLRMTSRLLTLAEGIAKTGAIKLSHLKAAAAALGGGA